MEQDFSQLDRDITCECSFSPRGKISLKDFRGKIADVFSGFGEFIRKNSGRKKLKPDEKAKWDVLNSLSFALLPFFRKADDPDSDIFATGVGMDFRRVLADMRSRFKEPVQVELLDGLAGIVVVPESDDSVYMDFREETEPVRDLVLETVSDVMMAENNSPVDVANCDSVISFLKMEFERLRQVDCTFFALFMVVTMEEISSDSAGMFYSGWEKFSKDLVGEFETYCFLVCFVGKFEQMTIPCDEDGQFRRKIERFIQDVVARMRIEEITDILNRQVA